MNNFKSWSQQGITWFWSLLQDISCYNFIKISNPEKILSKKLKTATLLNQFMIHSETLFTNSLHFYAFTSTLLEIMMVLFSQILD